MPSQRKEPLERKKRSNNRKESETTAAAGQQRRGFRRWTFYQGICGVGRTCDVKLVMKSSIRHIVVVLFRALMAYSFH